MLGLCFGSFINALVWRIYKKEELTDGDHKSLKSKKSDSLNYATGKYSILHGRSMCPKCEHPLNAKDLMPVISWLSLSGKCRYCKKTISYQYPLVELITAGLFVGSYVYMPLGDLMHPETYVSLIAWLIIVVGLVALAVYDAKWMILPNKILYPLIIFTILSITLMAVLFGTTLDKLSMLMLAVIVGCGFFGLIYVVSKGKWIGFGDVKLAILLGLLVATPLNMFITIFLSSVLGMIWIMPLMLVKKLKPTSHIPFGPFLIAACIIVVIFGPNIVDLYHKIFLI